MKNEDNAHAKYAPSSSNIWLNCSGSIELGEEVPEEKSNDAAEIGTMIHRIAHTILSKEGNTILHTGEYKLKEHCIEEEDLGNPIFQNSRFQESLEVCLDAYFNFLHEELKDAGITKYLGDLYSEERVEYSKDHWGTVDFLFDNGEELYIIDLKTGRYSEVPVEGNTQLLCYLNAYLKQANKSFEDYKTIKLCIVAPFLEDWPQIWEPTMEDFIAFKWRLMESLNQVRTPYRYGKWCEYCPAKPACPEIAKRMKTLVEDDKAGKLKNLTAEELAESLTLCTVLNKIQRKLINYARKRMIEDKEEIPGYKLVHGHNKRKWKDGVLPELERIFKNNRMYDTKLRSPFQLEKLVLDEYVTELKTLWEYPGGGYTVTRNSSLWKAVNPKDIENN